ncbi:MAG: PfkB family carbohydrate kinase [Desulfobacula sp.]|nr:PfkB family carbohydrate kinase [Desulfobacula sp.]
MILVLGEILFDIFPDGKRLGGAPFNFAFHLKSLGFDVRFVSRVGQDHLGKEILSFLAINKFDTRDIQIDPDHPTGTVNVNLNPDGSHKFCIAANTAYDHMVYNDRLKRMSERNWRFFYTGTLIQRNQNNVQLVEKVLANKASSAQCFCDINLRPGCYTTKAIRSSLRQADALKINEEELDEIMGGKNGDETYERVRYLMEKYSLNLVILTQGAGGSQWFLPDTHLINQVLDNKSVIEDTVGAGDAYAAMAVAGLMKGLSSKNIMDFAEEFAGFICRIKGALPDDMSIYQEFKRRLKQ